MDPTASTDPKVTTAVATVAVLTQGPPRRRSALTSAVGPDIRTAVALSRPSSSPTVITRGCPIPGGVPVRATRSNNMRGPPRSRIDQPETPCGARPVDRSIDPARESVRPFGVSHSEVWTAEFPTPRQHAPLPGPRRLPDGPSPGRASSSPGTRCRTLRRGSRNRRCRSRRTGPS